MAASAWKVRWSRRNLARPHPCPASRLDSLLWVPELAPPTSPAHKLAPPSSRAGLGVTKAGGLGAWGGGQSWSLCRVRGCPQVCRAGPGLWREAVTGAGRWVPCGAAGLSLPQRNARGPGGVDRLGAASSWWKFYSKIGFSAWTVRLDKLATSSASAGCDKAFPLAPPGAAFAEDSPVPFVLGSHPRPERRRRIFLAAVRLLDKPQALFFPAAALLFAE